MSQTFRLLVIYGVLTILILGLLGIAAWRWMPFYAPELTVAYSPFAEPVCRIYFNQDEVNKINYVACRHTDFGSETYILDHINRCTPLLIKEFHRLENKNDDQSEDLKCNLRYPLIDCYQNLNANNRKHVNTFIRDELLSSNPVNQREMIYYITEMYWEREESLARTFCNEFSAELLRALPSSAVDAQCHHAILSFFQFFDAKNPDYIKALQQQLNTSNDPIKVINLCIIFQSLGAESASVLPLLKKLQHDQRQCPDYPIGFNFKKDPPFETRVGVASSFVDAGFDDFDEALVIVCDYAKDAVTAIEASIANK